MSALTLQNSAGTPIADQRVDLLRENASNTGVRVDTDASGVAAFEILPGYMHRFKVYHNGGTYQSDSVAFADDVTVQTGESHVELLSGGVPLEGMRVDLLRENLSNTGVRVDTDASGVSAFEILPGYTHSLKAYVDGETFVTAALTFDEDAVIDLAPVSAKPTVGQAVAFDLGQNYPNPANPSTTIRFSLPEPASVTLSIFSLHGQRIRELAAGNRPAGSHEVLWDGHDNEGRMVASGIYFYRLDIGERVVARKLTLLR